MQADRVLVSDFDGLWTDVIQEGAPFTAGYIEDLARLSGLPLNEVQRLARERESDVLARPHAYGWTYNGTIVAPASVDPYLRMGPVADLIFDRTNMLRSQSDRQAVCDLLFLYNYRKTHTVFRPDARRIFEALAGTQTYIVTNSDPDTVRKKLRSLDESVPNAPSIAWIIDRVHGGARKYVVDATKDLETHPAVAATLTLRGLERPVHVRRPSYFAVLDDIRRRHEVEWKDVRVVGDIFELDGALPIALGAWFGLLANEHTPQYERDFLASHPRGRILNSLGDVVPFLHE
ncbi:MAG: hypothetical protein Q7S02_05845 [bacterium]|nr:hypothetical protein [bacterium]